MGTGKRIDVYRHADAPRDVVWRILEDHRGYARWNPFPVARLEQEGTAAVNGTGAATFTNTGDISVSGGAQLNFTGTTTLVQGTGGTYSGTGTDADGRPTATAGTGTP